MVVVPDRLNRALYDGNLSLWWLLSAVLSLWFTAYCGLGILFGALAPPTPAPVGPAFALHLVTCSLISWICIWNLFHTPSHGPRYRSVHKVLGRAAMLSGGISTLAGFYTAWVERYNPNNMGFSIGISIGGALQLGAQALGWYFVRRNDIPKHQLFMSVVFFYGCCIPLWMRFPHFVLNVAVPDWWNGAGVVVAAIIGQLALAAHRRKRFL
ncbi:hypothetical protein SPRG_12793 [Saprolegnia parasitica CBS 223.65]|uniref:Cytochrome b561 domain-containing protein n=1 Tax=Saprolegnia parasitica (strain CBS 223.65) TaxID=695850 RepID=A0A067C6A3_SAPPC|nr:hypothetical protein SPRG_12793 [Saprolegnia parasitica CBS 223.65]KDO22332.1 hypothetical protein SPRG_12793 [Saprolegnia parasitica CBS 223.65]|eukprot:XP_012206966.1 hypothetical protein SPRG_12793 [Saprolegnia parasitica CBS 223.65]